MPAAEPIPPQPAYAGHHYQQQQQQQHHQQPHPHPSHLQPTMQQQTRPASLAPSTNSSSYLIGKPPPPSNDNVFSSRTNPGRITLYTVFATVFITILTIIILFATGNNPFRSKSTSTPAFPPRPIQTQTEPSLPSNFPTSFPTFTRPPSVFSNTASSVPAPTTTASPPGTTLTPTSLLNQRFRIAASGRCLTSTSPPTLTPCDSTNALQAFTTESSATRVGLRSISLSTCLSSGPPTSGGFSATFQDCALSSVTVSDDGRITLSSLGMCLGSDLTFRDCTSSAELWVFTTV